MITASDRNPAAARDIPSIFTQSHGYRTVINHARFLIRSTFPAIIGKAPPQSINAPAPLGPPWEVAAPACRQPPTTGDLSGGPRAKRTQQPPAREQYRY